jgi:hypothetical protein
LRELKKCVNDTECRETIIATVYSLRAWWEEIPRDLDIIDKFKECMENTNSCDLRTTMASQLKENSK